MKEFNLFKLHGKEDKTPRKWICNIGDNLNKKIDELVDEIVEKKGITVIYVKLNKKIIQNIYQKAIWKAENQFKLAKILNVNRQNLYRWKEGKSRILLVILKELIDYVDLKITINKIIIEKKEYISGWNKENIAKVLAKRLNVSLNYTEEIIYNKRQQISFIFIIKLLNLWKNLLDKSNRDIELKKKEIQGTFKFLKQNSGKAYHVKVVPNLNIIFSKIVGAILADGSVTSFGNVIYLGEEYKENVKAFSDWIEELFCIKPIIRRDKRNNLWYVKIDNKVIKSYLTEIFCFNRGKKKYNYDFPEIIKNSNFEIRKACVKGIMIFDGVVRLKREIGLNIGSKNIRDSVFDVLIEDCLKVNKLEKPDSTGMWRLYSIGGFNKEQYGKWLDYFVESFDKWYRIYEWINGFQGFVESNENASFILKKSFPRRSSSKISLSEVFDYFIKYNSLTIDKILVLFKNQGIFFNKSTL